MTVIGAVRRASIFIATAIAVYLLHWGKDFLMPLVLAFLLMDVLSPVVEFMRKWRIPNAMAVTLVTVVGALLVAGGILLLSRQILTLTARLPDYRENIVQKAHVLRESAGGSFARLTGTIQEVSKELASPATTRAAKAGQTEAPVTRPVPVEIVGPGARTTIVPTSFITPIIVRLGNAAIVFTLLFFLLLERDLVRHRLNWLMRRGNVGVASQSLDQASLSVGRYLRTQLLVNSSYATIVAISLWLVGLPSALLLGAVGGALRYIPYVGPVIGITLPTALSIAVFSEWFWPLIVLGILLLIELTTYLVLEPLVYGTSTGVSSIGVVLASFFWGWMWGPMGLILAMPMTVWIVIVGRHIPGVRALAIALSSEEVASVEAERGSKTIEPKADGWAE